MTERTNVCLTDGGPVTEDHREIDPATGMQKGYVVLTPEERAKGFVRPYRESYVHVGKQSKYPLRPLTEEEQERHAGSGYVMYEKYPESESPLVGRGWTQKDLDKQGGCKTETKMGRAIAETYARDPKFYSRTFCCGCGEHFPLEEFRWEGTDEVVGS